MSNKKKEISIGYIPISNCLTRAGDRRRFVFFAKEVGLKYEIYNPQKKYDLIIATTQADPKIISNLPKGTKLIYDFPDAYITEKNFPFFALLKSSIKFIKGESKHIYLNYRDQYLNIIKKADKVICSSIEQSKILEPYCKSISVILDSHFEDIFKQKKSFSKTNLLNIAWEGQHSTLPAFINLAKKISKTDISNKIIYHVVTDKKTTFLNKLKFGNDIRKFFKKTKLPIIYYPWSIDALNNLAEICDIAILPVDINNERHFLKPENRIHIYMRLGLPVIAEKTPSNFRCMNKAGLNSCASSIQDWNEKIKRYIVKPDNVKKHSEIGLEYIERYLRKDTNLKNWREAIEQMT